MNPFKTFPASVNTKRQTKTAKEMLTKDKSKSIQPGQVVLCWHLLNSVAVIPRYVPHHRIASNLKIFGFELARKEVNILNTIEKQ
ncbi:MAG: hypothetical protein WKF66_11025 [Pedobacter sp.]